MPHKHSSVHGRLFSLHGHLCVEQLGLQHHLMNSMMVCVSDHMRPYSNTIPGFVPAHA